jgi:hypothetical protein
MDKQICVCIYEVVRKKGPLARQFIPYLYFKGTGESGEDARSGS